MEKLFWLAMAGALGTLARYGVATIVQRHAGDAFPWGVLAANLTGSFLFGLVWAAGENQGWISEQMRVVALVGFLGAFTTFSTFAFNNAQMIRTSDWVWLAGNLALNNVLGIALVFAGFRAGRVL
ncbi:MAG: CrcB family protein [Dehalococcoidia bacterium]